MKIAEIIGEIEKFAAPSLQEKWDNTGLQVGNASDECTGVVVCLDPTVPVVEDAIANGCNLVISHHPLLFKAIKNVVGKTSPERVLAKAIKNDIAIYSSHTASDSALGGVSYLLAERLGIIPETVLDMSSPGFPKTGLGQIGNLAAPVTARQFLDMVKDRLSIDCIRTTKIADIEIAKIKRVAVCGGAGAEFASVALELGADAYVTADVKYHDFVDYRDTLLIVDAGHYNTEAPVREEYLRIIKSAFPALNAFITHYNENPINYHN